MFSFFIYIYLCKLTIYILTGMHIHINHLQVDATVAYINLSAKSCWSVDFPFFWIHWVCPLNVSNIHHAKRRVHHHGHRVIGMPCWSATTFLQLQCVSAISANLPTFGSATLAGAVSIRNLGKLWETVTCWVKWIGWSELADCRIWNICIYLYIYIHYVALFVHISTKNNYFAGELWNTSGIWSVESSPDR